MEKSTPSNKCFYSFCLKPKLKFEFQNKDEETLLIIRAHPITQLFWMINALVMIVILLLVNLLLPTTFALNQIIFINFFGVIFIIAYCWFNFLNWYFNLGIVTDKRIIDVDYYYILYKEITVAYLNKVQDITLKSGGFFNSVFNYGNIFVQTAGTDPNIEFINVPKPNKVREIISNLSNHNV